MGGDEDYLDSSDCWSDDSDEQLDVDVVRGVDIPTGRRSKKVRYDEDCEVSIFELGMVFEGATQFTKAMSNYVVEYMRLWMLRGSPCPHAICAYYYLSQDPDQHVAHWYKKETFLKAYDYFIQPIPNMRMWPETTNSSIEPPKSRKMSGKLGHKRPYSSVSFVVATGGNRRPTTDFGVYSDPTTGAQVFNPDTSSEKILHRPTKLKSASPTNIDIDFKPRGLKWKGKDAISTSQLQQMKENKKNKGPCGTSKK
ncbi:hypothetical protein MTR67_017268 [Solanum verrucosum]|uniref:Uncharacterized protein n=1 Tax=Solanum verrucosum TaxID=315347 RepID=A0AAF0QK34_SOLVR|nr:hypothetical protein MTR67_017268 [Solanum verrucosum]